MKSIKITARVAGVLYLMLGVFGAFNMLYVRSSFVIPGDTTATVNNILEDETLFRIGVVSDLIGQVIFIILVLALYQLLKGVNKNHASLMVILALVGIPIAMLNMLNQGVTLLLLSDANYLAGFETTQVNSLVMLFLDMQEYGISIAQIFWGLWLFPLGYLVYKSGFLPRIIGVLLMIGCFGYLIDSTLFLLFPEVEVTVSQFTFIGEMLLPLWLVFRGVDPTKLKSVTGSEPAFAYQ